ncbi:hypothetical protein BT96DRAFT_643661 [Gymnopus androsaceus JB14]|uniref:Uncharacterized protein n=1 Tax=Gymnopus androsaceus JB14 TaxID=1447944 RepID=A0A6A4HVA9_9AGAR|nr:hypothetical protein BT96DRAFT_643661 [Gymnopus androsaceus JB14]
MLVLASQDVFQAIFPPSVYKSLLCRKFDVIKATCPEYTMSDSFSLPETLVQLGEQALQPLSWTPLTWVLVITLAITLGVRRTVLMYFPFVTMKRLRKIADRTDEALGRYKNI